MSSFEYVKLQRAGGQIKIEDFNQLHDHIFKTYLQIVEL